MTRQKQDLPAAYRLQDPALCDFHAKELPRCIFIEVTNLCNLHCATCPHTLLPREKPATLDIEQFRSILDQFPTVERVVLHGIGEPLLNTALPQMIRLVKEREALALFNTNATLLTPEWSSSLIESGLDELRCSVDSADPDTYARIREAPLLPQVLENLRNSPPSSSLSAPIGPGYLFM